MNKQQYQAQREKFFSQLPVFRQLCSRCLQPDFGCYCQHVETFDPRIQFVILIHPIEARRRIATGRMSHLCLQNSHLIMGQDYSENARVNQILKDPTIDPYILYPGSQSQNLSASYFEKNKKPFFHPQKIPTLFVIDGTWATARKTMRLSQNLKTVPRICFTPVKPSQFKVRQQPKPECYSTIEAIHHTIELLAPETGFDVKTRAHDNLLSVFQVMVQRQLQCLQKSVDDPHYSTYRRPRFIKRLGPSAF